MIKNILKLSLQFEKLAQQPQTSSSEAGIYEEILEKANIWFDDNSIYNLLDKYNINMVNLSVTILPNLNVKINVTGKHPKLELYILFHEKVHVNDSINKSLIFKFLYLFPQILIPFLLLFCFYIWWLGLVLAALCILPYPAYFRKNYELKAYKVTLFVENKMLKEINYPDENRIKHLEDSAILYNRQFTGGSYYYMWRRGVEKELNE